MDNQMKIGDYVIITKVSKMFGGSDSIFTAISKKTPCIITATGTYPDGKSTPYSNIEIFPATLKGMYSNNRVTLENKCLKLLTGEELKEAKLLLKKEDCRLKKLQDEKIAGMISKKKGYLIRDFNSSQKEFSNLLSNRNAYMKGKWDQAKNTFSPIAYLPNTTSCCAGTQCQQDLEIYIPKIYLDYFGYSKTDLERWLNFLSNCEIDFKYSLEGLKELPTQLQGFKSYSESNITYYQAGGEVIPFKKDYYCVRVNRGTTNMHTYMKFICVRYLYNNQYWSIPGTAMQIKRELGDKITHWQALLMAHLRMDYYNFYCLVNNQTPTQVANPFQSPEKVISNLFMGKMNASFSYSNMNTVEIRKAITKKDYKKAFSLLKENKKN